MKRFFTVSLLLFSALVCYCQDLNKLDSLKISLSSEKSDTGKVILCYRIAYELQFSDPEQSLLYTQRALDNAEKLKFERGIGNSFIQFGNLAQIRGDYIMAEEYNLKALKILTKIGDLAGVAVCSNNLGILAQNKSETMKAMEHYFKALSINRKLGRKTGEATSLFCIGSIYENKMSYDSALKYYYKAQALSESISDTRLMAIGNTSMANVYFMMENYAESFKSNTAAITLFEKAGNDLGLLKVYSTLGLTAERLDTAELAIWFYMQALIKSRRLGSTNDQANTYFSIGGLYENKGITDSARFYYENALTLFRSLENRENTAFSLIALARINNNSGDFKGALRLLKEAGSIGKDISSPGVLTDFYSESGKTFSGLKDFRNAFSSLDRYILLKDSLLTAEKQKQILKLQTQYETIKKEKENESLRKDQKLLQNSRNSLIIGSLLLLIIALLILRSLNIKKKDNKLLQEQKAEIEHQKEIVELQKTSITDSIRYAKRIQSAMLPPDDLISGNIPDSFILYLPRDIVSGDFYLLRQLDKSRLLFCVADCTGHGVPGAFMSMLGMSLINDIVNLNEDHLVAGKFTPADILNELRERIKKSLRQTGKEGEARDGMDISFCMIDKSTGKLTYSGANNPIYIVFNETLTELKATRNPIGIYPSEKSFTNQELEVSSGSVLYLFSDGYSDQIGSEGGKFLSKNFKLLLTEISHRPMNEIKETLYKTHLDWRKDEEQVDDILVAGIKI